jgi:hypothetical protein
MQSDQEVAGDELGRAVAAMARALSSSLDMVDLWRAFAELHARDAARESDLRAMRNDGAFLEDEALELEEPQHRPELAPSNPLVLLTRINAMAASTAMQMGLRWQELLSRRIPEIRRRLDDYRSEEDPSPEMRWRLVDEMRQLLRDIGEFAADQGHEVQLRLNKLEYDLLPPRRDDSRPRVLSGKRKN